MCVRVRFWTVAVNFQKLFCFVINVIQLNKKEDLLCQDMRDSRKCVQWTNYFGHDVVNEKYGVDRLRGKSTVTISGVHVGKFAMFFFHGASRPQKP